MGLPHIRDVLTQLDVFSKEKGAKMKDSFWNSAGEKTAPRLP